jgi:hypothetical protein
MERSSWTSRSWMLVGLVSSLVACGSEVGSGGSGGAGGTGGAAATSTGSDSTSVSTSSATGTSATTGVGGGPSFAACSEPGTCALALKGCCAPCGAPTLDNFDAIFEGSVDAHRAAVCPDPAAEPCPKCPTVIDSTLFAYCDLDAGACKGARLDDTRFSECTKPSDCVLRLGLECCECGSTGDWVAVANAKLGELQQVLCTVDEACAKCQPQPPPEYSATCNAGRCEVVIAATP